MALGFVQVTFSLPFIPIDLISIFLTPLNLTTVEVLAVSGGIGFLIFIIGFELWERNRKHINEV